MVPATGAPRVDTVRIEAAALSILAELGVACRLPPESAACCRAVGIDVGAACVRFPPGVVPTLVGSAPRRFTHLARNADRKLEVSAALATFGPAYSARHIWTEATRMPLDAASASEFAALAEAQACLGYGASALHLDVPDLTAPDRLIRFALSTDRPLLASDRGPFRPETLIAAAQAATRDAAKPAGPHCSLMLIATVDGALIFDDIFVETLVAASASRQGLVIAPTLLIGANAPARGDELLVRFAAETLAGLALAQALCPGQPVALGATISDISLRNGLPLACTADAIAALGGCAELARHWDFAYYAIGPATNAKGYDALATAETARWLTAAHFLGANAIVGPIGAVDLDDGVSVDKLIIDAETASNVAIPSRPVSPDPAAALLQQGHGGYALGTPATRARARSMRLGPLDDNQLFESWVAAGSPVLQQRLTAAAANARTAPTVSTEDHAAVLAAIGGLAAATARHHVRSGLTDLASSIYGQALREAFGFKG